jgi:hypothetical protein
MKGIEINHEARDNHWKASSFVALVWFAIILSAPAALSQDDECSDLPITPAIFEDEWIKVTAKDGWSSCQPIDRYDPRQPPMRSAGLFRKDDFRLYFLTHNSHASPVPGGRFVEVARFVSPWVELEVGECACYLDARRTKITRRLSRVDLYFDAVRASGQALDVCGNPETKNVFWYGSYFAENCPRLHPDYDECGSFYIDYPRVAGKHQGSKDTFEFVSFSVTFATDDPDYLPLKGDPELEEILKEATSIVRRIKYK